MDTHRIWTTCSVVVRRGVWFVCISEALNDVRAGTFKLRSFVLVLDDRQSRPSNIANIPNTHVTSEARNRVRAVTFIVRCYYTGLDDR